MFVVNYLGADQASFTLNFSRGASQIIGQYYQLIRLGKKGYRSIMMNLTRTADYLAANLEALGMIILSKKAGEGLPLVAFRLPDGKLYDEFSLAHQLRERGIILRSVLFFSRGVADRTRLGGTCLHHGTSLEQA